MKKIATTIAICLAITVMSSCSANNVENNSKLQESYSSVCAELNEANNEISNLKSEIDRLESEIDGYKQQISELQNNNSTITGNNDEVATSSTIYFDGFEISLYPELTDVTAIDNRYSEIDGHPVIALTLEIKNCANETKGINPIYVSYFGASGVESDMVYYYFDDGSDIFRDLKPGASITGKFYMLYDGEGIYYIEFDNFSETKEMPINIVIT